MMDIGEKIKEMRKKNGLTQEQLADCLRISYQAVSKWETGAACPDLSLIVPLTRILHVSADELLGINDTEPDARYEELKKEFDLTFATEDFVKRQEVCETAVKEYPGDMKWLSNLAWTVSNRSFEYKDNETHIADQEKAIKLFDAVIKNSADEYIRGEAIVGITQLLGWRGRKDEAKQYAEMLPERCPVRRDSVMENVLDGDELMRFKQNRLNENFEGVLQSLQLMHDRESDCPELECMLIATMIPDGNYLIYHLWLYCAKERMVHDALKKGDKERIISLLSDMKYHVKEYDKIVSDTPGIYHYTVPHLRFVEEDTREWLGNKSERRSVRFQKYIEGKEFDFIRDDKEFQNLLQ